MKKILFVLGVSVSLMVISCSPKFGCGGSEKDIQRHDSKPFRVMRIRYDKKKDLYYVYAHRYRLQRTLVYECLPDSIYLGKYINL